MQGNREGGKRKSVWVFGKQKGGAGVEKERAAFRGREDKVSWCVISTEFNQMSIDGIYIT
jgi:hypothetical protein